MKKKKTPSDFSQFNIGHLCHVGASNLVAIRKKIEKRITFEEALEMVDILKMVASNPNRQLPVSFGTWVLETVFFRGSASGSGGSKSHTCTSQVSFKSYLQVSSKSSQQISSKSSHDMFQGVKS